MRHQRRERSLAARAAVGGIVCRPALLGAVGCSPSGGAKLEFKESRCQVSVGAHPQTLLALEQVECTCESISVHMAFAQLLVPLAGIRVISRVSYVDVLDF